MKNLGNLFKPAILLLFIILIPARMFAQEDAGMEDLDVSLGELLNLEISVATKTAKTLEEAPSIVSVITGEEIKNMGARNFSDVLRSVPGFDFNHTGSTPQHQPFIRGTGTGATCMKFKILMNGTYIGALEGVGYMFDYIPLGNIRQIEIIRGPGSALYGTGAFVGVMNIVTKKGGDGPSTVSFEAGSHDTVSPYGELSYKKDDFSAYFFASVKRTDGYDGAIESDMTNAAPVLDSPAPGNMTGEYKTFAAQTRIDYKKLWFQSLIMELDSANPVGVALALSDEADIEDFMATFNIGYELPVADKGSLLFKTFYTHYSADRLWEIFPEETAELDMHTGFPPGEGLHGHPMYKAKYYGAEITGEFEPVPWLELIAGASYVYSEAYDVKSYANHNVTGHPLIVDGVEYPDFPFVYFHTGMTDLSETANWFDPSDRDIMAVYMQNIIDIRELLSLEKGFETLSLTLGGRYDNYSDIGDTTNPRAGLVWAPVKDLWFKAMYGTAFRAPTFHEMTMKNNPALTGNKDLEPETIETLEGLVGFNFAKHFGATVTFYQTKFDETISTGLFGKFQNMGQLESRGVESELRFRLDRYKYAYANFTWQDVKNTTNERIGTTDFYQDDFNPGSIPEITANLGINYDVGKHMIANVSVNYVGEKDRSEEKTWDGEKLVQVDTRDPVDACVLFNASLTFKDFGVPGAEFQISGFNIFDEDHRSPEPTGGLENDVPESGRWIVGRISCAF